MTVSHESQAAQHLLTIKSVRETNRFTQVLLKADDLTNFDVHMDKMDDVVSFVSQTISTTFPTNDDLLKIPGHGRYQHFEVGSISRLTNLISSEAWNSLSDEEKCRKLIDLFIVSVLLDAGAGNSWKYTEGENTFNRSEGIAVASFHMFVNGVFSSDPSDPFIVSGSKLVTFSKEDLASGFQVSDSNPLSGFDGRLRLLQSLGAALEANDEIFGSQGRPGYIFDYLKSKASDENNLEVDLEELWGALMRGLNPIWPDDERLKLDGVSLGDSWRLSSKIRYEATTQKLEEADVEASKKIVTFHKLTQWLTYSLLNPLESFGHLKIVNASLLTGLPEYRNGGLFADLGVLVLKNEQMLRGIELAQEFHKTKDVEVPAFTPADDVIVEWRSCTICLLDMLLPLVNEKMQLTGTKYELSLAQLIEAGSWKSGRLMAAKLRPSTSGSPIELLSDGTVF